MKFLRHPKPDTTSRPRRRHTRRMADSWVATMCRDELTLIADHHQSLTETVPGAA
jgi:hypothetical protein